MTKTKTRPQTTAPIFNNALEAIGNTPMVKITKLDTGKCRLFLKLENQNPTSSIKDRIGSYMVEQAEKDGLLKKGDIIVEGTAGNTGLALALIAKQKGYRLILVVPDKMAQEKIFHLKAMGAEVHLTRSDVEKGHPEYYQDMAESIAKDCGGFYINQFSNPANAKAHELGTGPEILAQMNGDIDAVICGVGSGGTITGLSHFFQKASPKTEMIVADPKGSIITPYVKTGKIPNEIGSWIIEGIGEDFIPPVLDLSNVKKGYTISDKASIKAARDLLMQEGLLGGSSTGTLLATAIEYCKEQTTPKNVVTFICDSGNKYLSKIYNDFWMYDNGLMTRPKKGDLRDYISRPADENAVISIKETDTIKTAANRMRLYNISQLPILDNNGKVKSLLTDTNIHNAISKETHNFSSKIKEIPQTKIDLTEANTSLKDLNKILGKNNIALITHKGKYQGIITKMDMIQKSEF